MQQNSEEEEENNSVQAKKLVPEGDDFKLVFISSNSDSSKESELNSSLEGKVCYLSIGVE